MRNFRYEIPCTNFFRPYREYFLGLIAVHDKSKPWDTQARQVTEVGQDTQVRQVTEVGQDTQARQVTEVSKVPQVRQVTEVGQDT